MINAPKESVLRAGLDASEYTRGAQEIDRANTEISASSGLVEQSQEKMTRSLVSSSSSMDRLQASLDKGFASQLRYEQIVDRVNSAMERGRISQERGAQIISLAQQRYMSAATATAAMGAATAAAATSGRNFGAVAQQAGYQIGDFASQVASGGSAVTAFVQQGSQMLGMFGMFGAVAGAALAIGGVAYQMWAARDAAKAATDEVSSLTAEIKRMNEESARRGAGDVGIRSVEKLADLRGQLVLNQSIIEQMKAQNELVRDAPSQIRASMQANEARADIGNIEKNINALQKQIREYENLILIQDAADMAAANRKRRGQDAEDQRRREAEATRDAARAQEEAIRAREEASKRLLADVTSLENTLDPLTAATRRWADQQALLAQALDAAIISQERYNELVAMSDEAFRKATEKQTEYLTGIEKQSRENENLARDLGLSFQSAFEDAILRGEKLRGVLAGIAQDIARIILRQTVTTPLAGLVMGGLSSAFGGLFGGSSLGDIRGPGGSTSIPFGGPRALGGPVEAGSAYLVGEQGPELFMPGQSGRIIPNGQTGGTVVNQTIQISVGVAQTVRAEIAALMPAIKRQTVDAVADARMRGGSFAAAMGT
jgi:hypothetical protein